MSGLQSASEIIPGSAAENEQLRASQAAANRQNHPRRDTPKSSRLLLRQTVLGLDQQVQFRPPST